MWKKVWGALDSLLSFVGLATLILFGLRYWRGLPVLPSDLISAPTAASVAVAPTGAAPGAAPGASPAAPAVASAVATLMPIVPIEEGKAGGAAPAGREEPREGSQVAASAPTAPVYKMAHDWRQEISVTVNSSRYVKSLADLAPAAASLPDSVRRQLKAAQQAAGSSEMLLVCNVTVEYSGGEEVTLDQSGFKLVSPERQVYPSVPLPFSTRDIQPLRATLLASGSAKGDLVFAVKRGVQPDEVLYQPQ